MQGLYVLYFTMLLVCLIFLVAVIGQGFALRQVGVAVVTSAVALASSHTAARASSARVMVVLAITIISCGVSLR